MKKTKGVTLIEIVVAMAIFLTVVTLAVGAFIIIVRMRSLTGNMRDSQQKLRFATEKISRLARQANTVTLISSTQMELSFKGDHGGYRASYTIIGNELKERECIWSEPQTESFCANLTPFPERDMLGGSVTLLSGSKFEKSVIGINPSLDIYLIGKINGLAPYYEDGFTLAPTVTLEGLK